MNYEIYDMYHSDNWWMMFASISFQMALVCLLSNRFGPHLSTVDSQENSQHSTLF